MTAQWRALPTRQPGEALSSIEYRNNREAGQSGTRYIANFRHRDNRIWQALLTNGLSVYVGDDSDTYNWNIELSSAGCRPWRFMSMSLDQAKRTVSRFANLNTGLYNRLIADASGTTEHPKAGSVGVFRMRFARQNTHEGRSETHHAEIDGIAYIDGTSIIVFPTSPELFSILSSVCAAGTVAFVPQGINQIVEANQPLSFVGYTDVRNTPMPDVSQADFENALSRLRDDTAEGALTGLRVGDYVATPRVREDRVLDIFDDDGKV